MPGVVHASTRLLEILGSLLLNVDVASSEPIVLTTDFSELAELLSEASNWALVTTPVGELLYGEIPDIPGVRAVQKPLLLLFHRRKHPKS
jgi:hypothetical protein